MPFPLQESGNYWFPVLKRNSLHPFAALEFFLLVVRLEVCQEKNSLYFALTDGVVCFAQMNEMLNESYLCHNADIPFFQPCQGLRT